MIDSYEFGRIVVDGRLYTSDIMIRPNGVVCDSWRRESGHLLARGDVGDLIDSRPDIIIAGQGNPGMMSPTPELVGELTTWIG